ncbi:metallophosphoesterase [Myxococcus xanthus DK 1622]|uniref:Metallophosphoesterase n=1 Tax=Myxococcus xanthus (strain DK1622) TaxID=246197 RepID=Q1D3U1_MYXXD|nr:MULTISPECIES: DNA repair exonuclease [Myxococcus]ABF90019.1 metallophosphoesterase [Myxococcus xanthus DK 1622]NOJ53158.1 DNA repair exonuclease [Myxococcus xanthus]QPM77088.1 DNA repair exonuclease [Myxococcus xanthus]QVW66156.1 DNA repair exonuclease [Myxococcus xanthus DZ2]UEO07716.1 DNA repair exonuclease [Myxococcus xanthus DZ2]
MVRILHSADWQMGLRARHVAHVAEDVRKARLEAASNVISAANRSKVDAVVLAGDIFEHNVVEDRVVHAVIKVLAGSLAPVYVLPGNHDALTPDAVFRRASWNQRPDHITVLDGNAAVPIPHTDAVLLPAPLRQKKGMKDPTAGWEMASGLDVIRIGVAHGSLRIEGKHAADDFPIALDAAVRAGLDYLALGHWHGQYVHDGRTAYSGAHETTKFGEVGSGQALLVELSSRGAVPRLEPIATGALTWRTVELDLSQGHEPEVARARELVAQLARPERALLRIHTTGFSSEDASSGLEAFREELQGGGLLHVCIEREDIPRAKAEGRLADIAGSSSLVSSLLDGLNKPAAVGPGATPEPVRTAARQLLSELVMEVWK